MTISRRTFGKSTIATAAVLLLPSWLFAPRKVRHIDLGVFCDPDVGRYDLSRPFLQEGLTYATDGHICVRTGLIDAPPEDSEERRLPKAAGLSWWEGQLQGWQSLDGARRVSVGVSMACPTCFGKGRVGKGVKPCAKCEGEGWYTYFDDDGFAEYEKRCPDCETTGYIGGIVCGECQGSGLVDYAYKLAGGWIVAPIYVAKLRTLGAVDYAVDGGPESDPVRLKFDGGEGLVMGMRLA